MYGGDRTRSAPHLPRSAAAGDIELTSVRHQERAAQRLPRSAPFKAKLDVAFVLILYHQNERQEPIRKRNVVSRQPPLRACPRDRKAVPGLYRQKHGGYPLRPLDLELPFAIRTGLCGGRGPKGSESDNQSRGAAYDQHLTIAGALWLR